MMIEIALETDEEWDSSGVSEQLVRRAAEAAVAESAFPDLATSERTVELSVRLAADEHVRALNAHWRGKDKSTNVLSFPMMDEVQLRDIKIAGREFLLGDLVLARGVCEAEAADKGVSVEDHATHLIVHGTLHLLGYDHQDEDGAAEMEAREVRALQRLGIANPYEVSA
jgi:probable rRNA maturation factor